MGHGILPLTQRGSPHGRRILGSGRIGIDLNGGLSPAGYAMMCIAAAALGRGAVHNRKKPAPNVLCHSVLLSKNSRYFCPQSVVLKKRCSLKYFVDLVIE